MQLGGGTNLHGGLRRAFDAYVAGPARRSKAVGETVEASELARGPTTIFVLSDGAPTENDWGFGQRSQGRGGNGAARAAPSAARPFQETRSLVDDVMRLNLFRGCEIHGVGIGEFAPELFDRLTRVGNGKVRRIGSALRDAGAASPDPRGPSSVGRTARDAVETFERLGLTVPDLLRKMATEEAKEEKALDRARKPAPPAVDAAPAVGARAEPTPDEDRATLRTGADAGLRAAAARRLGTSRHGLAVPELVAALFDDADEGVRGTQRGRAARDHGSGLRLASRARSARALRGAQELGVVVGAPPRGHREGRGRSRGEGLAARGRR